MPSATDFPSTSSGSPTATDDPSSGSPTSSPTGASGDDASDLVDEMVDAMKSVDSGYTVSGDFDDTGAASALELQMQGTTGKGTITIDGDSCQIRAIDGMGWANAAAAFWTEDAHTSDAVAAQIAGRWVELSGDIVFLLAFVDQETFADTVIPTDDDYTLGDTTTRDGVDAVEVEGSDATLVIAADSPHLLLAITDDTGTAAFTFPDSDLEVAAPSPTVPYPG